MATPQQRSIGPTALNQALPHLSDRDAQNSTATGAAPAPESPPLPLTVFQRVANIIREYEYAKRQHDRDTNNEEKYAALVDAANKVDIIWYHYNTGHLTPEAYILVDLFLSMWLWDSDLLTPSEQPGESTTAASDTTSRPMFTPTHAESPMEPNPTGASAGKPCMSPFAGRHTHGRRRSS